MLMPISTTPMYKTFALPNNFITNEIKNVQIVDDSAYAPITQPYKYDWMFLCPNSTAINEANNKYQVHEAITTAYSKTVNTKAI